MKITRVRVYAVDLPGRGGAYRRSIGFSPDVYSSTVVIIDTDGGISGIGEVCPIGTHYMRGFPEAVRAGLPLLAGMVIGEDPFQIEKLNRMWDVKFRDDLYVKTPIDMALWDIMGKATGRPVSDLLGGSYGEQVPLYRSVHLFREHEDKPAVWAERCKYYRSQGYRHFQLKMGHEPDYDIERIEAVCDNLEPGELVLADANAAWTLTSAIRVANAVKNLPVVIEQPCRTMEECIEFRRHCTLPVKLDELIETTQDIIRAFNSGAMDICCIKLARVGGLTKARRMRDLCIDLGLTVVPDDAWGSEIVSSALAHFAESTPAKFTLSKTDLTDYVKVSTAYGYRERIGADWGASSTPGLGLEPRMNVLGEPVAVIK
ncbi:MAG: mandelate racemase/muconate lactonizing enzyme family protein [Rhizobiales bacterium]|nr:mandelate racemase/muconate lactonizing enzyme family protein [Hyphomicrobiales bacterium]